MRYLSPESRSNWRNNSRYKLPLYMKPVQFTIWKNWARLFARLTLQLQNANVPLLAGTDAGGPPGIFPGSSIHEELQLLVQAGLTPYQALRTATVNPARYLNTEKTNGIIAPGYQANLVLLEKNPLQDIQNTTTRLGVMKKGHWYSQQTLQNAITQLAENRQ